MAEDRAHAPDFEMIESEIIPGGSIHDPGKINKAVMEALAERLPPDYLAAKVKELIDAKRAIRHKDGSVSYEPDVRANEAGLKLAYAYQVGKPIERAQIITKNITDADDPVKQRDRLRKSPALRASLARMIDEVENETGV
jgi:hypothetical protein